MEGVAQPVNDANNQVNKTLGNAIAAITAPVVNITDQLTTTMNNLNATINNGVGSIFANFNPAISQALALKKLIDTDAGVISEVVAKARPYGKGYIQTYLSTYLSAILSNNEVNKIIVTSIPVSITQQDLQGHVNILGGEGFKHLMTTSLQMAAFGVITGITLSKGLKDELEKSQGGVAAFNAAEAEIKRLGVTTGIDASPGSEIKISIKATLLHPNRSQLYDHMKIVVADALR
jgi:hypothetical protein